MASIPSAPAATSGSSRFDHSVHPAAKIGFFVFLAGGIAFAAWQIFTETQHAGEPLAMGAFAFLGLALLIALAFEFVNGFHDTANAVATVIYTNSLTPPVAVIWSGLWNFAGVIVSSGAVAYSIITLLPVELILNVGSTAGYAMIFALLIAALLWNLLTWYFGIPNSSSHALIGSILGVGLANQLLSSGRGGTSGVDWGQAEKVLSALLFSPFVGFVGAFVLFYVMKALVNNPTLYKAPEGDAPPPKGIRALLIFTCTAVSFAHGGNDGQKGMGLIMLILIGVAPTAYALNRTMADSATPAFVQSAGAAHTALVQQAGNATVTPVAEARTVLRTALAAAQHAYPRRVWRDGVDGAGIVAARIVLRIDRGGARGGDVEHATRHVSGTGRDPDGDQGRRQGARRPGRADEGVRGQAGTGDALYPDLGEDRRRDRARAGHHGRLEADRRHRGREDRQAASDLCDGCLRGIDGGGDHPAGGVLRRAGVHDAHPVIGGRRVGGRERTGIAGGDDRADRVGLGADAARRDAAVRAALLVVPDDHGDVADLTSPRSLMRHQ